MKRAAGKLVTMGILCAAMSVSVIGAEGVVVSAQSPQEGNLPVPVKTIDLSENGEEKINKEHVFDNPFGTKEILDAVTEYRKYEEVKVYTDRGTTRPVWKKGLSVSYWIKVPSTENGNYLSSAALRWELDQELPQDDDYAKYMCCSYFDKLYQEMSEEEKEAAKTEESKVPYGSDFYFKYLETGGTDEDGAPKAAIHTEGDLSGPVYDNRYFAQNEEGLHVSRYYAYNPEYRMGFVKMADGTYFAQQPEYADAFYKGYHTMDISAGSQVRRADVHGELQIDVDNSVMWVPQTEAAVQKNPDGRNYGETMMMQPENLFYMNSWTDSSAQEPVSYEAAETAALSPVTAVSDGAVVKNGNCDKWHQVVVTFQNDGIGFYVDGTRVSTTREYGINGGELLEKSAFNVFRGVNKGSGLRDTVSYYTESIQPQNISYAKTNHELLLEWLTDENAKLSIGGAGSYAGQCNLSASANVFYMDDINFYGELLDDEQVQALYQKENETRSAEIPPSVSPTAAVGDVNGDGIIDLKDAQMALKYALKLVHPDAKISDADAGNAADVNGDGIIDLTDAQKILKAALKLIQLD